MDTATRMRDPQEVRRPSTAGWARLARGAALTMVVWSLALQATVRALIPPVAMIGVVFFILAAFLAAKRRRLGLALAVFTALAYAGNLPTIVAELGSPESAPTFILTLLSSVGAAAALLGGLGMYLRWSSRSVGVLTLGAAGVLAVGSIVSLSVAATTESEPARAHDVAVAATRLGWEPGEITIAAAGGGVWVDNRDPLPHTLTVEELGLDLHIPAFTTRRADVEGPPGTYRVICTIPGHESMTATLEIRS